MGNGLGLFGMCDMSIFSEIKIRTMSFHTFLKNIMMSKSRKCLILSIFMVNLSLSLKKFVGSHYLPVAAD